MTLNIDKHEKYFKLCLNSLPSFAQSEDSNKLAIIYFCLHGLQLLNRFNLKEFEQFKNSIIDEFMIENYEIIAFRSTHYFRQSGDYDLPNLSSTLFALYILLILEIDFIEKLNLNKIMNFLIKCQVKEGGFVSTLDLNYNQFGEADLRLCYIALCIRHLIKDKTDKDINIKSLIKYILNRQNINGGFSSYKNDESHLGFTFCAIASLKLLNYKGKLFKTQDWLIHRQVDFTLYENYEYYRDIDIGGFNGRENKFADTCYSWWCTSSLEILNFKKYNLELAQDYLLKQTQNELIGGFSKEPNSTPDPLHSYLAIASLSLWKYENLLSIDSILVISDKLSSMSPDNNNKNPDAKVHLISGAIAGLVSAITLQPFDLLKTRLQQQQLTSKHEVKTSLIKELKKLTKIKDLWRGTLPSTLRTSIGAGLYFTILSKMRSTWAEYKVKHNSNLDLNSDSSILPKLTPFDNLATGFIARAIVGYITMPVTLIKTRFESNLYNYNSMYEGISGIYLNKQEPLGKAEISLDGGPKPVSKGSIKNFFNGSLVTLARDCPYAGLYVLSYEGFKNDLIPIFFNKNNNKKEDNTIKSSIINSMAAISAAITCTTVTAPFDAIKTRLQLTSGQKSTMVKTFKQLINEDGGIKNLFRGLSLRLGRKAISAGISWCIYEELIKSNLFTTNIIKHKLV
ncbi:unnamed protein product [Candida verbasci]|uniref:Mitochondrial glycine transporter n=1 Tax=Candida verbasci TaxID=1227364 RepID=A0A9W4XEY1_9ASCO|nr:unnamed protein product [Candida verbasci]